VHGEVFLFEAGRMAHIATDKHSAVSIRQLEVFFRGSEFITHCHIPTQPPAAIPKTNLKNSKPDASK
jgi:hypothetical protein